LATASRGPSRSGTRMRRVVVSCPRPFVLTVIEPVDMDHIIVTSSSPGKPWPVTATMVPGVPMPGFSSRLGGGRRGREVVVVVVGNVVVVVFDLALVCSWVVVVLIGV